MNSKDILRFTTTLLAYGAAVGGCKQEEMLCNTAHGSFAVRYTLTSGAGACAELKAGVVGVQPYVRPGPGQQPRYDKVPVALKAEEVGVLVGEYGQTVDPTKLYSLGNFASERPDGQKFCALGPLTPTEVNLAAVDSKPDGMGGLTDPLPAVAARWEWRNVRFYVEPAFPGTQFLADLTYTLNGCTATYQVQGLYPAHGCARTVTGDGGPTQVADPEACSPCADPAKGRRYGSGISPDIEVSCDPDALMCLPTKAPPSRLAQSIRCPPPSVGDAFPPYDRNPPADAADAPIDAPAADADLDAAPDASTDGDALGDATAG